MGIERRLEKLEDGLTGEAPACPRPHDVQIRIVELAEGEAPPPPRVCPLCGWTPPGIHTILVMPCAGEKE